MESKKLLYSRLYSGKALNKMDLQNKQWIHLSNNLAAKTNRIPTQTVMQRSNYLSRKKTEQKQLLDKSYRLPDKYGSQLAWQMQLRVDEPDKVDFKFPIRSEGGPIQGHGSVAGPNTIRPCSALQV